MIKPIKLSDSLKLTYEKSIEADKVQLSQIISLLAAVLLPLVKSQTYGRYHRLRIS